MRQDTPQDRLENQARRHLEERRVTHRLDVSFVEEEVTEQISMDGWRCWSDLDGDPPIYYAEGPCPGCGAVAHGIVTRDNGPFERLREEKVERHARAAPGVVQIVMECHCGHPHGEDGAHGCGRTWVIECPGSVQSEATSS